jgi:hypothetical protein
VAEGGESSLTTAASCSATTASTPARELPEEERESGFRDGPPESGTEGVLKRVSEASESTDALREITGVSSNDTFPIKSGSSDVMELVREMGSDKRESLPENEDVRDIGAEGGPSSSNILGRMGRKTGPVGSNLDRT